MFSGVTLLKRHDAQISEHNLSDPSDVLVGPFYFKPERGRGVGEMERGIPYFFTLGSNLFHLSIWLVKR